MIQEIPKMANGNTKTYKYQMCSPVACQSLQLCNTYNHIVPATYLLPTQAFCMKPTNLDLPYLKSCASAICRQWPCSKARSYYFQLSLGAMEVDIGFY